MIAVLKTTIVIVIAKENNLIICESKAFAIVPVAVAGQVLSIL